MLAALHRCVCHLLSASRGELAAPGRSAAAALFAGAIFGVGLLASNPHAHEEIHDDAHHEDHACAVTLVTQGFCDTAALPPVVPMPEAIVVSPEQPRGGQAWSPPRYWHLPSQGPPLV